MSLPVTRAAPLQLPILFIDAHLLVIDKPAGVAVHPGPSAPRSLDDHLWSLREGFVRNPQPSIAYVVQATQSIRLAQHGEGVRALSVNLPRF